MTKIVITQNDDITRAITAALQPMPLASLVRDKIVAVKPNDTWASKRDKTAVTQRDSLRAVLRHVKRHSPKELIVTGGSGAGQTHQIFKLGGLMDVVKEEGATYYGHPRASLAHHKNQFYADMPSFIAAMAKRFPISLAIIVGRPAMIGHGPIGGHTFETGLAIASTDALAADAVGARLLGFNVEAVEQLREASKLGVGEAELSQHDFPALTLERAVQIFTEKAFGKSVDLEHA